MYSCLLNVRHILEKVLSMQHSFEEILEKQRRDELKSVGNFVVRAVLVESVNQFSLEEVCRTQNSLKFVSKPYRPSDLLKNLKGIKMTDTFIVFSQTRGCMYHISTNI